MAFDENFNFISVASKALNAYLDKIFIDADGAPITIEDGVNYPAPLQSFKRALTIKDSDSLNLVVGKLVLGLIGTGYFSNLISEEFYGVPKSDFKQSKTGLKNQIIFYFVEPKSLQRKRKAADPKRIQIAVNIEGKDISLSTIQQKIKLTFPEPSKKTDLYFCGLSKYSYFAPEDGIQITQLRGDGVSTVRPFIERVLSVFDIEFKPERLKESKAAIPTEGKLPNVGYVALKKVVLVKGRDSDLIVLRLTDKIKSGDF